MGGMKESQISAEIELLQTDTKKKWTRPPISMNFEVRVMPLHKKRFIPYFISKCRMHGHGIVILFFYLAIGEIRSRLESELGVEL